MNIFDSVKIEKPKGNKFDLTHDVKFSGRMGNLIPILVQPTLPGDNWSIGADTLVRFAPLIAPVMHRMDATIHYWFVPNRLIWENWQKWIANEPTGGIPQFIIDGTETPDEKKFLDYMGVPPASAGATPTAINALPFAAYNKIYQEWYKDENLIPDVNTELSDGVQPLTPYAKLRKRAWEHDYFTASLPWAQKGNAVAIPLGDVTLKQNWPLLGNPSFWRDPPVSIGGPITQNTSPDQVVVSGFNAAYNPDGSLEVTPTSINTLRTAFKLQSWLEKNARGGTRYTELILMHFGIRSSDARLQRPEYITGTKSPVIISEVLNTTGESGGLPQGNMAGHGVSVGQGSNGRYYCEEHGYIIGIMSIMAKPSYQQGIPKDYLKDDPFEYAWPDFANLGEQPVTNNEIYAYTPTGNETFGYVPKYAEYKFIPNRIAGDFRTSLDYWHLGRIFSSLPTLSQQFIEQNSDDLTRIFAVTATDDNLYIHVLNKITAYRLLPVFGTPML